MTSTEQAPSQYSYGGYFYHHAYAGRITLFKPGSGDVLITLPDENAMVKFVDECNKEFTRLTGTLTLHLTGCKRCTRTLKTGGNYDDPRNQPCRTGAPLILQAKSIAQQISDALAKSYKEYLASQRVSDNVSGDLAGGVAEDVPSSS